MSDGISHFRSLARELFMIGVKAADPGAAVRKALEKLDFGMVSGGKLFIVAIGKAACPMLREALCLIPDGVNYSALAVTNYENVVQVADCVVLGANHPVPDENGLKCSKTVLKFLSVATEKDLVLTLISGGGSALMPCPAGNLTLEDEKQANELLLASGLNIKQINLVRQQFSSIKGGGLIKSAAPARVLSFLLSDVPDDNPSIIASGLTAAPLGVPLDAKKMLHECGQWEKWPKKLRNHIERACNEVLPDKSSNILDAENIVIGSNKISVQAMLYAAKLEFKTIHLTPWLKGDVSEAASMLVKAARDYSYIDQKPVAVICGGETSVTLKGKGKGGRSQELCLRFAYQAAQAELSGNWVFLSGGTDGCDGNSDAAGGLVDPASLQRMSENSIDIKKILSNNDSFHGLKASDDLLVTGATGTNVADLQVLLLLPKN